MSKRTVEPSEIEIDVQIDGAFADRVSADLLTCSAEATLRHQGIRAAAALSIVVGGDEALRQLNLAYRGVDAPTDVLAFGNEDAEGFVFSPAAPDYLGDVIVSFPRAEAQAQEAGHPVQAELQLLTVHGVLHLLGHDHADLEEKAAMWSAQSEILHDLNVPVADPAPELDE